MLRAIKEWVRRTAHEMNPAPIIDRPMSPTEHALVNGAQTATVIFRIDNGFVLRIDRLGARSIGSSSVLLFAASASEIAEKIVANEASFRMGVDMGKYVGAVSDPASPAGNRLKY